MPSRTRSGKPTPNIINLLCGHYDLVLNLADVLSGMKQYASLSSLSAINQEYHAILQPYLKSKKRRIVVELSDVRKLSKSRYKDIEIVECSPHSVIPEERREEAKKRGQSRYQAGLKPWLLTFRGSPEGYLSSLQQNHAPGVEVVRVVDGTRKETSVEEFYDPKDCHPFECGCYDEDPSLGLYDNYLSDFFLKSASKSMLARNFRYQAAPPTSTQNRIRNLYEASHEMDMVSASGQTWEYRRRGFCSGAFDNIIHEREELERYCACGMCYVCQCGDEKTFGFDNLSFEPAKGHIGSVSFRTYLSVPVGQSIDKSFQDRMAYIEFAEGLRAMAVHHLDLRKTDAKASFDLYIHHGSRPRQPRTDMKPVFSLKIVRGSEGGKAIIDRIDIDENFLDCKANRGCDRCTSPPL